LLTALPNWVDLVILILVIRGCYVGFEYGVVTALLQLLGAVSATALSINFGPSFWALVKPWFPIKSSVGAFVVFWFSFAVFAFLISHLVRRIAGLMKWERLNVVLQGAGLICGSLRGWWWSAVLLVGLSSSSIPSLQESAEQRSLIGIQFMPGAREMLRQAIEFFPASPDPNRALFPSAAVNDPKKDKKAEKKATRAVKSRQTVTPK